MKEQGIGASLVAYAEDYILASGLGWAEIGADSDNSRLRAYFTKRGYFTPDKSTDSLTQKHPGYEAKYEHTYKMYKNCRHKQFRIS